MWLKVTEIDMKEILVKNELGSIPCLFAQCVINFLDDWKIFEIYQELILSTNDAISQKK